MTDLTIYDWPQYSNVKLPETKYILDLGCLGFDEETGEWTFIRWTDLWASMFGEQDWFKAT